MNHNTLNEFRHGLYGCFERAGDALFDLTDALLTETTARSLIELSLSPLFQRQWPSLYEALEDGRIERSKLRKLLASYAPWPAEGGRVWMGVDASSIARPEADTSRDRTPIYVPNLPQSSKPMTLGWQFSTLVILPEQPGSGTYILDSQRIESSQTAAQVAAQQLAAILPLLPWRVTLVADRFYGSLVFLRLIAALACDKLLRLKANRVLYRAAPPRTGKRGAPRKHGARFKCNDASTHGPPDEEWQGSDEQGQPVEVACWRGLHFREGRDIEVSVMRVIRHGATERKRDPKVSWFLWQGTAPIPLVEVRPGYHRRYSQEHGYRFDKQALLWATPRLRTPEQFERWTDLIAAVHDEVVLAQASGEVCYRPWENQRRAVTPQQVRRAMPRILSKLGTPAKVPQPRGKSPGRPKGATIRPAPRYPVVKKPKPTPKKQRKRA
ncbi:MAG TPA: NF041680 family putative transposase [Ktedonobacteraceae bacterium]|nr:NF041680 family putative transposase [Ktedonobacteraceae bacterium]